MVVIVKLMNVSNKGFLSIILIVGILASLLIIPNLGDNKTALIYLPFIDHNKIKAIDQSKINSNITKAFSNYDFSNTEYITQKCSELQKKAKENVGILQQSSFIKNVCEEQDKSSSIYEKGVTVSYNLKEVTMYKQDGSKYNLSKGCHSLADTCTYNGSKTLVESYCDVTKQVITSKEIECPEEYLCNKGACVKPLCGDGLILNGEECDDGNNKNGDGCDSGCKLEKKPVDLYVGKIEKDATSKKCMNYFSFEICNVGPGAVAQNFNVLLKVEDSNVVVPINIPKYGAINPNACISIDESGYANILGLKVGLNGDITLEVIVNYDNLVEEENESNNSKSEKVFSGSAYMYDEITKCETSCYDSDGGWQYPASIIKGTTFLIGKYEMTQAEDNCSLFGLNLKELYCEVYADWKGELYNLTPEINVPCYLQKKKCEDGKCVDLEAGESKNNLSCIELEDPGIFSGGDIIFSDFKGEKHNLNSFCSEDALTYYWCDGLQPNTFTYNNCWYENAICVEDRCVKGNVEFSCGEKEINYFKKGYLELQKNITIENSNLISFTKNQLEDSCEEEYGQILKEVTCGSEGESYIDYNCAEVGAACYKGACVFPDLELKNCFEQGDNGLDVFTSGQIGYTNEFGVNKIYLDLCLDENKIMETYCDGQDYKVANMDCKDYGDEYLCVGPMMSQNGGQPESEYVNNAFCGYPNDSKKKCTLLASGVEYTNEFGLVKSNYNGCENTGTNDDPNYVSLKWTCLGNNPIKMVFNCKENESCKNNAEECKPLQEPQCFSSDGNDFFKKGNILFIDKFGQSYEYTVDNCDEMDTICNEAGEDCDIVFHDFILSESYCQGSAVIETNVNCKDIMGNDTAVCYNSECKLYNSDLNYCKETEFGIEVGNGYAISKYYGECNQEVLFGLGFDFEDSVAELDSGYWKPKCEGLEYSEDYIEDKSKVCVYKFKDELGYKKLNGTTLVDPNKSQENYYIPFVVGDEFYPEMISMGYDLSGSYDELKQNIKKFFLDNLTDSLALALKKVQGTELKVCLVTMSPLDLKCPDCYTNYGVTKKKYYTDFYNILNMSKPAGIDVCVMPDN